MNDPHSPVEGSRRYGFVKLNCVGCGAAGRVRWDRMDSPLHCRRCSTWFRLGTDGRLARVSAPAESIRIEVRGGLSGWQEHRLPFGRREGPRIPDRQFARWAVIGALSVAIVGLALILHRPNSSNIDPIPPGLEPRARLLAEAWMAQDVARMVRLTDSTHDRTLRRWLAGASPLSTGRDGAVLSVVVRRQEAGSAEVVVRVGDPGDDRHPRLELQQHWIERAGAWFFVPSAGQPTNPTPDSGSTGTTDPTQGTGARRKSLPS